MDEPLRNQDVCLAAEYARSYNQSIKTKTAASRGGHNREGAREHGKNAENRARGERGLSHLSRLQTQEAAQADRKHKRGGACAVLPHLQAGKRGKYPRGRGGGSCHIGTGVSIENRRRKCCVKCAKLRPYTGAAGHLRERVGGFPYPSPVPKKFLTEGLKYPAKPRLQEKFPDEGTDAARGKGGIPP